MTTITRTPVRGLGERRGPQPAFSMGLAPRTWKQSLTKLFIIAMWLVFCTDPVHDLNRDHHSGLVDCLGWAGLGGFVLLYLGLVFRHTGRALTRPVVWTMLAMLSGLALLLTVTLGPPWLVLFVYVAAACGAVLPLPRARFAVLAVIVIMVVLSLVGGSFQISLLFPAALAGFCMTGVRTMVLTTVELRRARADVAQLAATEERLRMARDLHDLLGHSLSLITLKSELAGRMLPGRPDGAAQQVADIEQVSRQAMADVRAAVTGYRRLRIEGELAAAKAALGAAQIGAEVPVLAAEDVPGVELPRDLTVEAESALAWTLREAVTNVVRHSGAGHCEVTLARRQTLDGAFLELRVSDDGVGGTAVPGNGLTGIRERLAPLGGTLDLSSGRRGGFVLFARVPPAAGGAVRSGS